MSGKKLKIIGWGYEGEELSREEHEQVVSTAHKRFGGEFEIRKAPTEDSITLHAPRLTVPAALAAFSSTATRDRLVHTYGHSYPDYARALERDFRNAPDLVCFVRSEADIEAVYDYASGANVAVIPFGGRTSVCGGVEPAVGDGYNGTISLDLTGLDAILEVDKKSRAARIQAGIRCPAMEDKLKEHGLTMRHFPQSMELATLGGMIATRSGGHYATLYTHIDDFVESLRMITPTGVMESRRLPGSGAGPSPDRMMIGSEGSLGIITEAWMRLQDRPKFRGGTAISFDDVFKAAEAVRVISQAALFPANIRLLDSHEAYHNGFGDGRQSIVVLSFESSDHPVGPWLDRALAICRDFGGSWDDDAARSGKGHRSGAAEAWRHAFIRMPYYKLAAMEMGIITDTFETSITWERFPAFYEAVMAATEQAVRDVTGQAGAVSCRFTHCYPDGPAPYISFKAKGRHGALAEQWLAIKSKALDAVIAGGGTVTHHHAVGRDHMPWYRRQRPELFGRALAAAKSSLDPKWILNPGVLLTDEDRVKAGAT